MALHHNASNMHLSLTRCTSSVSSPLLCRIFDWASSWVYWPCHNSCQMCARCQHCVRTAGTHTVILATLKPQEDSGSRACEDVEVHWSCCLYHQYCAVDPREGLWRCALLWVRAGRGSSATLEKHCFLQLHASMWGWLCISRAFTQRFVPSLPGFTSMLVYTKIKQVHQQMSVPERT